MVNGLIVFPGYHTTEGSFYTTGLQLYKNNNMNTQKCMLHGGQLKKGLTAYWILFSNGKQLQK